jgi:cytochrome c553
MTGRNGRAWTSLGAAVLAAAVPLAPGHGTAKDLELGRYLAAECLTCHRAATASSAIPNIFGLPEEHFTEAIRAYRDKKLPNPIMQSVAGRLTDEDIASLALYFATVRRR